jgi:O-antigen/teichoic acid export membrane protein
LAIDCYQDPSFAKESIILHIVSLSLITGASSKVFSYLLIANGLEKLHLIEVIITTVVGNLAGIILIYQYQLFGAALMTLSISFTNFFMMTYFVYNRLFKLKLWPIVRRPLLISAAMSIVFVTLDQFHLDILMTIVAAVVAYVILASFLILRKPNKVSA